MLASMNSNRKAERPVNVVLNYLYALLEVEAILACQVVGLDPGLGLVHADTKSGPSLDLIEPVRPRIDNFALDLLQRRTFWKAEFVETDDGHCRLRPPLTHELAETLPMWAKELAPMAERIAHLSNRAVMWCSISNHRARRSCFSSYRAKPACASRPKSCHTSTSRSKAQRTSAGSTMPFSARSLIATSVKRSVRYTLIPSRVR